MSYAPKPVYNLAVLSQRYEQGETLDALAAVAGVSRFTLKSRLKDMGVRIRTRKEGLQMFSRDLHASPDLRLTRIAGRPITTAQINEIAVRYKEGESLSVLASEIGVGRPALRDALNDSGVKIRTSARTNKMHWDALRHDPAAFQAELQKGLALSRFYTSHPQPISQIENRAKGRRPIAQGKYEREVWELLAQLGHRSTPQYAFRKYNIDLAIPESKTAIEVCRLGPAKFVHFNGRQRTIELLTDGWYVIFIFLSKESRLNANHVREQLEVRLKQAALHGNRNGAFDVIWGSGHQPTYFRYDIRDLPCVAPLLPDGPIVYRKVCESCNEPFVRSSRTGKPSTRFCSLACANRDRALRRHAKQKEVLGGGYRGFVNPEMLVQDS